MPAWQIIWEQSKCDLIIVQSSPSEYVFNLIMSTVTCDVWRVTCDRNIISIYLYWSTSTSTFLCPHDNYGNISSRTKWIINSALKLTKVGSDCTIIVNINKPKLQHTTYSIQQLWPAQSSADHLSLFPFLCSSLQDQSRKVGKVAEHRILILKNIFFILCFKWLTRSLTKVGVGCKTVPSIFSC